MEIENNEVIEEQVNTEEVVEPASLEEAIIANAEPAQEEEEAVAEPTYEPDFTYKVYDEVRELPENVRQYIKDKETEDMFREIYGKSGAFDTVKEKYSGLKEKVDTHYSKIENDYNSLNGTLDELSQMVQRNDMHSFFQALGVPEEKIMQYALQRAEYQEMSPEQRAQFDNQYQQSWQSQNLAKENQQLQDRIQQQEIQTRTLLLDNELAKNADFVSRFDERFGQGAFRQEVINAGTLAFQTEGRDLMPGEIVGRLQNKYGSLFVEQANQQPQQVANNNQVVSRKPEQPTLPNVQGGSNSPAQKVVTSLADLRKLADSM